MFENFNPKDKKLISLDLGTPAPRPVKPSPNPTPAKPEAKPAVAQICVGQMQTLEGSLAHFTGAHNRFAEMVRSGLKPEVLFYIVFPQQGLTHSLTTSNGSKTILPLFNSKIMAEAYIASKKMAAGVAACRLENLPRQADQWTSSGINSYNLNTCCRCTSMAFFPISDLQTEELFLVNWRLDLANRRQFAAVYGQNAAAAMGKNQVQVRIWLEGLRDHIDPANPYLHWVIAILAGLAGDMDANAASIKRLEAFGPPFIGKLQGTSFDLNEPGSQLGTMAEASIGLGVSLGYLDPAKMAQAAAKTSE